MQLRVYLDFVFFNCKNIYEIFAKDCNFASWQVRPYGEVVAWWHTGGRRATFPPLGYWEASPPAWDSLLKTDTAHPKEVAAVFRCIKYALRFIWA